MTIEATVLLYHEPAVGVSYEVDVSKAFDKRSRNALRRYLKTGIRTTASGIPADLIVSVAKHFKANLPKIIIGRVCEIRILIDQIPEKSAREVIATTYRMVASKDNAYQQAMLVQFVQGTGHLHLGVRQRQRGALDKGAYDAIAMQVVGSSTVRARLKQLATTVGDIDQLVIRKSA